MKCVWEVRTILWPFYKFESMSKFKKKKNRESGEGIYKDILTVFSNFISEVVWVISHRNYYAYEVA